MQDTLAGVLENIGLVSSVSCVTSAASPTFRLFPYIKRVDSFTYDLAVARASLNAR